MQNKKMVVLGGEVLPLGMKLAGVKESYTVHGREDAERMMLELLGREDVGIIVVTEGIAGLISDRRIRHRMENSLDPLVISVADYNEKAVTGETLRRLTLRAVGIDIMQKGENGG